MQNMHFAIQRIFGTTELRNYGPSSMGCGKLNDDDIDDNSCAIPSLDTTTNILHDEFTRNTINDVHKLPMDLFRNKLIQHFDILFRQNKIQWPRSNSKK